MATITKKAAKRISDLLEEARLNGIMVDLSARYWVGGCIYYGHSYREGVAVRALFDEFGIEVCGLGWYTADRIEGLRIASGAERAA